MQQFSPHQYFSTFGATIALGITCSWVCGSIFMGSFDVVIAVGVGGAGQSFLNLKRFPDIFPALGHGVPVQVGMFSSGGGMLSELPSWEGF